MAAADLLTLLQPLGVRGELPPRVRGLSYDSRRVLPGAWFFALAGQQADGVRFAGAALATGAAAVVAETETGVLPEIRVASARRALARAAVAFYGDPAMRLVLAGVTGTNGKTTLSWLLRSILEAAGWKTGLVGTLGTALAGPPRPLGFTTPEAPELNQVLAGFVEQGARAAVLEISSHGLALERSAEIAFDVTVFTNLTRDHLDFHRTLEAYLDAKLRLFDGRNGAAGKKPTVAVVHAGDERAPLVLAAARRGGQRTLTYAVSGTADVVAETPEWSAAGTRFTVRDAAGRHAAELHLPGAFNLENAVGAWAAAAALGVPVEARVSGLAAVTGVPGRMEAVRGGQPFAVYVDFAHTPDGLTRALSALAPLTRGRLLCLIGAGGDRDPGKRGEMGRIAAALADHVVFTSDNPRHEDPAAILHALAAGAGAGARAATETVLDRRQAIRRILEQAGPGDTVLLAGKGHETTQIVGDQVLPFDDRAEALNALAHLGYGKKETDS